jgi:hypothetical protein
MAPIMPGSGGWFRTRVEAHRAADQQLTPSTYMKLN